MFTEHSVTYELPGGTRVLRRQVFTAGTRILGSEITEERVWRGYDGWKESSWTSDTRHFRTHEEAHVWIDDMYREKDIAGVAAAGGTKLVILS